MMMYYIGETNKERCRIQWMAAYKIQKWYLKNKLAKAKKFNFPVGIGFPF